VADISGLVPGNRIYEINGKSTFLLSTEEVAAIFHPLNCPEKIKLLVADRKTWDYMERREIEINGDLEKILYVKTPKWALGPPLLVNDAKTKASRNENKNMAVSTSLLMGL